ncbi:glycosyl transferase [Halteromyces radiatus]|uniref:glycosyl transferase n=1 Tax=Halteromyces radiatus TaxID=101107 RepID=UPI00221EB0A6|nr:glycosyl transferase [Halteromyces radiatus]KAI8086269.1 glycosyl transferase [Halteromyces radiatus]
MKDPKFIRSSPPSQWIRYLISTETLWTAPLVILAFATLIRFAVALNPYSGYDTPPLFGDYEAQRHWMEITTHLPLQQWYRYDLQWWGLDYPPLTAYHSWLCGKIGGFIQSEWFALDTSRGYESPESKFFMRTTVIISELLIYIPAVFVFCQLVYGSQGYLKKHVSAILILLQPALIMVDHGHFQFNGVMLGFSLWTIIGLLSHHYILGAIAFCLALGFKQMALYYAPAVFAFLLGRCFIEDKGIFLFTKLGITVIISFALMFWPWLKNVDELVQVIHRIFPVARGLYEDKVANVWCTLNIFIKLRQHLSLDATMKLSLVATLCVVIPISIHLGLYSSRRRFIYALVNSSLAFFLFSFQVHEKSILLPLLPVTLLVLEEPVATNVMVNTAMFSMFPLLKRESLVLPYFLTLILWNWLSGIQNMEGMASRCLIWGPQVVFMAWHVVESYIPPPNHLPDLYTVINAVFSCSIFGLLFIYFVYRQFTLVPQRKDKVKSQ